MLTSEQAERFWRKVAKGDGCWLWTDRPAPKTGYGRFNAGGRIVLAHRIAWRLAGREIPEGHEVRHRCESRLCVNPEHLACEPLRVRLERECPACGRRFFPLARASQTFCSVACLNACGRRGPMPRNAIGRFWERVRKAGADDCWEWQGPTSAKRPHGNFTAKGFAAGRGMAPSRFSWLIHHGPIPDGLFVCHRCDNPPCVNPAHLFLGTPRDNVEDMWAKDRGSRVRPARRRYTVEQALDVIRRWETETTPITKIAAAHGMSVAAASDIIHGRTFKELERGPRPEWRGDGRLAPGHARGNGRH